MDDTLRQLIDRLRSAVSQALVESGDVEQALREVRREGWALYLVVDRHKEDGALEALEVPADKLVFSEAAFKIDRSDLTFLRSIGIDPTRKTRSKRSDRLGDEA